MKMNITIFGRRCASGLALVLATSAAAPRPLCAQWIVRDSVLRKRARADSLEMDRGRFYRRFAAGAVTSLLIHEFAHLTTSYAMGFHPHLGFDKGRPTVFSGIDEFTDPHKQFLFSAAGLTIQDLLDEIVLDVPHHRGGAFERGLLAGGIGTTLFYVTAGRNARVSDISVMARTSNLSKSQLSLIFGSVAAIDVFRMSRDRSYTHFFLAPADYRGGLKAEVSINTR